MCACFLQADLLLVMGSSLVVHPFASLIGGQRRKQGTLYCAGVALPAAMRERGSRTLLSVVLCCLVYYR